MQLLSALVAEDLIHPVALLSPDIALLLFLKKQQIEKPLPELSPEMK